MALEIKNVTPVINLPWEERPSGCGDVVWRSNF